MVVVVEHQERLLALVEERGRAVARPLLDVGEREADLAHTRPVLAPPGSASDPPEARRALLRERGLALRGSPRSGSTLRPCARPRRGRGADGSRRASRMAALHAFTVSGALAAIAAASSRTVASSSSTGTTRLTRPMCSASSALSRRAEKRISAVHDGPDQVHELLDPAVRVPEAELRRRHPELAVVGRDADVGLHRGQQPAADAVAADHGDDRLVDHTATTPTRPRARRRSRRGRRPWCASPRTRRCRRPTRTRGHRHRARRSRARRDRPRTRRGCAAPRSACRTTSR